MRNIRHFSRPNLKNYLGKQVVSSNYGKGGVTVSVTGFTQSTSSSGTEFIWTFQAPSNPAQSVGSAVTFSIGTASPSVHPITGSYYSKYNSLFSAINDGIMGQKGRDMSSFRVFMVGAGNGAANSPGSNPPGGNSGTPGGRGGLAMGPVVYTGINTEYSFRFGVSPQPTSSIYFTSPQAGINTYCAQGLGGFGGAATVKYNPASTPPPEPGSGGVTSDITGSSLGYGGGGGGGRSWGSAPTAGGLGVNGGGNGGPTGTPVAGSGTRGGGGGGAAGGPPWAVRSGGAAGPFYIIVRSSPDSLNKFS